MNTTSKFQKKALSKSFIFFLLQKLPLAYLAGVRLKSFDATGTQTTLRYKWINQNPFKSIYFAAMHMAAELATGLLLFQYLNKETPFSMLLIETQASFNKKATGKVHFQCHHGEEVREFMKQMLLSNEGLSIELPVLALNEQGEVLATFKYTWSCIKK